MPDLDDRYRGSRVPQPSRILVAQDRLYDRDVLSRAIAELRPDIEVVSIAPDALVAELTAQSAQLVIANAIDSHVCELVPSWMMLYPQNTRSCIVSIRGTRTVVDDITLVDILETIDCSLA